MANIDKTCFVCDQVSPQAPNDPKVSSDGAGPRRRAKNLFVLLQRALDLPDLVDDQSEELAHQICFCKSCLNELEVTEGVLDAFEKLKKMAERHKTEIQMKFLESKRREGNGKSNRDPLEVEGVTQLKIQFVAGLMSRTKTMTDSSKTLGVFKPVTSTITKLGHFPGEATLTPSTSALITLEPVDLPINSIPLVSSEILSADKEVNGEDGFLNILSENGHEALGSDDLHTGQGSPGLTGLITKAGPSGLVKSKKKKVSNQPASSTPQLSLDKEKPSNSTSIPRNNARNSISVDSENKKHKCNLCPIRFKSKYHLARHLRSHTGEKPFSCKLCPKKFSESSDLVRHMRTHSGEKPFKCNLCGKTFSAYSTLVVHMRTHTKEKPFKCTSCSKEFSDPSSLVRHKKTHKLTE